MLFHEKTADRCAITQCKKNHHHAHMAELFLFNCYCIASFCLVLVFVFLCVYFKEVSYLIKTAKFDKLLTSSFIQALHTLLFPIRMKCSKQEIPPMIFSNIPTYGPRKVSSIALDGLFFFGVHVMAPP